MHRALAPALALLFFACSSAPRVVRHEKASASSASSRRAVVQQILGHNVRLFVYDGNEPRRSASGVVVASERTTSGSQSYVITNAHAVDASGLAKPSLMVTVERDGEAVELPGQLVALGRVPEVDLALVRVRGVYLQPATLAGDEELVPGEDVVVASSPYGRAVSFSGGMVSHVEVDRKTREPRMLKTDAPIGYGAAGGGVYSRWTGKLLAVVEGYRTAKVGFAVAEQAFSLDVPMPGETFAAPSSKIRGFLEVNGYGRFVASEAASR